MEPSISWVESEECDGGDTVEEEVVAEIEETSERCPGAGGMLFTWTWRGGAVGQHGKSS